MGTLIVLFIFGVFLRAVFNEPDIDWDSMDRYTDSLLDDEELK